ncbi:acetyltransferase [Kitasatospora sp. MMS16-BH015]|uniref:GNAT family N-acetyltransferase n=1 Tax=Kitasatospora sp. MMS16-BH015 TaxID=2018025 RepID=UPI000CA1E28F|nr:GNAT family N-acetyltransferase [Kitasatospora sp. MMS16-BH015]AUG76022.1 acetyltransferase [Kitasatospora sp. MMS16-BH015]
MPASFPETAISTERLLLRPLSDDDAPGLTAMMADELVHAWTAIPQPFTEAHALEWSRSLAPARRISGRGIVFAVTEHLTQRLVGVVELRSTDWRLLSTEATFITASWARGEGYAPEAVLGVAQWLFEDRGFLRLELRTAAGNTAAQQVTQKIGSISEGVLRSAWIVRDGGESRSDLILWSLLPEDLETSVSDWGRLGGVLRG